MFEDKNGPVEKFEWGSFTINGQIHDMEGSGAGKDIFLLDGHVLAWEDRKGHRLKPEMVQDVLSRGIDLLVIGNGVNGRIKILARTRRMIEKVGIKLIVKKTPEACAVYNQLFHQCKRVALLAHGTC